MIGIVYCSSVQKHLTVFEDIRTARGVVCYLVNIIKLIQKAGKEVRVCEVIRVVGQLSIVSSRCQSVSQLASKSLFTRQVHPVANKQK